MTDTEPTLDELDAFCAGEMGFKKGTTGWYYPPEGDNIPIKDWQPSRNIAQAFEVLEKLPEYDEPEWIHSLAHIIRSNYGRLPNSHDYATATAHQRCLALWRMTHE